MLDLDYVEDVDAEVDMNVVMTGGGRFVEVQGPAKKHVQRGGADDALVGLARRGLGQIRAIQRESLGDRWPFAG